MSDNTINRRDFLKAAAAASAAPAFLSIVPRHVLGMGQTPPSDKLNIAGIGVGGKGAADLVELEGENIVALCDVDPNYAAKTVARYPGAKFYTDYRLMLVKEKGIDAVVIATPDHTHAVITLAAMQLGKHVYTQKPLTHSVFEARALARAAAESKVTTQMGIQGHSGEGMRLISEWISAGLIGDVTEVDAWCDLSYYPWGHASWSTKWGDRPSDTPALPPGMAWDLWIGPAPMRPYHPAYHPVVWRCWWDFGVGMMGDRGVHTLDPVYYALELGAPTSIEATVCGPSPETHPLANIVTYRFPARGSRPPVKLTWYDGLRAPRPEELEEGRTMPAEGGSIFKGTKGKIMAGIYGETPRLIPEKLMQEAQRPAKTIPRVEGSHEKDWARACKAGKKAGANFEYAGPLTEVCLLGNVAKRLDARLYWDAANMAVTNNPAAEPLIWRPYREGWSLE
jgi:predicted dehydrogenase